VISLIKSKRINHYLKEIDNNTILKLIIFLIYEIYIVINLQRHSMWRDEIHVWLVNKQSDNFFELLSNFHFDGKPLLYYLVTWPVSYYTDSPESLKFITFIFATATAFLILWKLRILFLYRLMILGGFLFTGGYSTISRDYVLLAFILFLLVYSLHDTRRLKLQILLLVLLPHVNVFGLLISAFFFIIVLIEAINKGKAVVNNIFFYLLVFISQLISLIFYRPKSNSYWNVSTSLDLPNDLLSFFQAWQNSLFPWNLENSILNYFFALFSLSFLILLLFCIYRINLILFFGSILIFLSFVFLFTKTPAVFWWHTGTLTIFLISILIYVLNSRLNMNSKVLPNLLLFVILSAQIFGNFFGFGKSIFSDAPYSNAKAASGFIEQRCYQSCVVIVNYDWAGASISGYLGGREVYKVDRQAFGTFTVWEKGLRPVGWGEIELEASKFENFVIVLNEKADPPQGFLQVKSFEGAVWSDENFYIYEKNPNS
jgi:hypothetical protein